MLLLGLFGAVVTFVCLCTFFLVHCVRFMAEVECLFGLYVSKYMCIYMYICGVYICALFDCAYAACSKCHHIFPLLLLLLTPRCVLLSLFSGLVLLRLPPTLGMLVTFRTPQHVLMSNAPAPPSIHSSRPPCLAACLQRDNTYTYISRSGRCVDNSYGI